MKRGGLPFFLRGRKVWLKWLLSYLVIFLFPLAASLGVFLQVNQVLKQQISVANRNFLHQIRDTVDAEIENAYSTMREMAVDQRINLLGNDSGSASPQNAWRTYELVNRWLSAFSVGNRLISSMYIYYNDGDFALLSGAKYTSQLVYDNFYSNIDIAFEEWKEMMQQRYSLEAVVLPEKTSQKNVTSGQVNLLFSTSYGQTTPNANIVMILDPNGLAQIFKGTDWLSEGYLMVTGPNGEIVYSDFPASVEPPAVSSDADTKEFEEYTIQGQKYVAMQTQSEQMGWTYRAFVPDVVFWNHTKSLYTFILLSLTGCVAVGIIILLMLLKRQYLPLGQLVDKVQKSRDSGQNVPAKDEYELIGQSLVQIMAEKQDISQRLKSHHQVVVANFIGLLLKGDMDLQKSMETAEALDLGPWRSGFAVLLFDPRPASGQTGARWECESRQALQNQLFDQPQQAVCYYANVNDLSAVLLNFDSALGEELVMAAAKRLSLAVSEKTGALCPVAASGVEQGLQGAAVCYQQALQAREYRIVMPGKKVIAYSKLPREETRRYQYNFELERKLIHCIKGNDRSGAEKIIDSVLTDQLIQCDMPMYMVRCLTFDLIGTFMKAASELLDSTGETDLEKVVPVVQILNFQTLDQLRASLLEVFDRIAEALQARHPNRSDTVVEQCLAYIQQNYTDNNLNIAAVAQAMEMNPNYLSRIFKEKQGCGILDYLNQLRVEKAKELLADPQITVNEAGQRAGYYNHIALIRAFKRLEGMTPSEWRSRQLETGAPQEQNQDG